MAFTENSNSIRSTHTSTPSRSQRRSIRSAQPFSAGSNTYCCSRGVPESDFPYHVGSTEDERVAFFRSAWLDRDNSDEA